jgi:CRP-like cAMP-binding protein
MRKALFFFGVLDDTDVEFLLSAGHRLDLKPGDTLIREGEPINELFLVVDGTLGVRVAALQNKEVARAMAGEVLGEISFVDSRPPSASVVAVERSSVLAVPRERLKQRLEEEPWFAARFYRALAVFLADRLRTTTASQLALGKGRLNQEQIDERDELDMDVLEEVSLASTRFDKLQRRVRGLAAMTS